jgi:hypothetical protein
MHPPDDHPENLRAMFAVVDNFLIQNADIVASRTELRLAVDDFRRARVAGEGTSAPLTILRLRMDPMVEALTAEEPNFVSGYKIARIVVDRDRFPAAGP